MFGFITKKGTNTIYRSVRSVNTLQSFPQKTISIGSKPIGDKSRSFSDFKSKDEDILKELRSIKSSLVLSNLLIGMLSLNFGLGLSSISTSIRNKR